MDAEPIMPQDADGVIEFINHLQEPFHEPAL
jgi:hypothetical protein